MRVLVACEYSGRVREAFRAKGHDAWSCDLLPAEDGSMYHYMGDVSEVIRANDRYRIGQFDLMIAHPPCTYLTVAGLWRNKLNPCRELATEQALEFVQYLMNVDIPRICIENPVSCISTRIRKPDQIIQPYQFGEDASKKTCLWLKGLDKLPIDPNMRVKGRIVNGKERWANQTDTGQNRLGPSPDRWKERSRTYQGIANAMAEAWG